MSDFDDGRGMSASPVSAETARVMALIWSAWRADIDAEAAADEASSVPLLTRPSRWTLPRPRLDDLTRLVPCAWRERREWCGCFRCDALSAAEVCAREIVAGRSPLALAPRQAARAAALAAAPPKFIGEKARKSAAAKAPAEVLPLLAHMGAENVDGAGHEAAKRAARGKR